MEGNFLEQELIEKILRAALAKRGGFAEVFLENRASTALKAEDGKIERVISGSVHGAGVRVISEGKNGYAHIDNWDEKLLLEAANTAGEIARSTGNLSVVGLKAQNPKVDHPVEERPQNIRKREKAEVVERADRAARKQGSEIRQVGIVYLDTDQKVLVANSEGVMAEDERVYTRMVIQVVAAKQGIIQTGVEGPGSQKGFEFIRQNPPEESAIRAARRALIMLEAKPAPTGRMPVVLEAGFGGVLFHEACGHGLEADLVHKKASVYAGRLGEKVASSCITAVDDSTIQNGWGSFRFDDEGVAAQRTVVIENGRLTSFLHNRLTAWKDKTVSTANGRRQSYQFIPIPRMTNTFIVSGNATLEDMVKGIDRGLYAKALGGGQVDTTTGNFVFGVSEGYLIENGKITRPVRGATLVGNGPKVLQQIDMVGTELKFEPGTCGKEEQASPVGTGQPAVRIRELTIGGTEV